MRFLLPVLLILCPLCRASDTYFAAASAGGNTGADCADAYAYNDGTHGLGVAGTWVAGATLHLCGTFTGTAGQTLIASQGGGMSGSPITLKFETGAVLSAPYWGGSVHAGAINITNSYIVVDGGTNGIIENTANGTSLTYQQASVGVFIGYTTTNVEVKNLNILNMYLHTGTGGDGAYAYGIWAQDTGSGNNNLLIHNNTIAHARAGVIDTYTVSSNVQIYSNVISGIVWGVNAGSAGSCVCTMNILSIYKNSMSSFAEWANIADTLHMDGMIIYSNSSAGSVTNVNVYDNYVSTDFPTCCGTSALYYGGWVNGANTYNNLFVCNGGPPHDAYIYALADNNLAYYNNTIIGCGADVGMYFTSSSGVPTTNITSQNNVITQTEIGLWLENSSTFTDVSNNSYYSPGTWYPGRINNTYYSTLAAWQTACNCDANSLTSNSMINSNGTVQSGSPAIGAGVNLTSLGIVGLDTDAAGYARPASGAWDIGAYEYTLGGSGGFGFSLSGGSIQ